MYLFLPKTEIFKKVIYLSRKNFVQPKNITCYHMYHFCFPLLQKSFYITHKHIGAFHFSLLTKNLVSFLSFFFLILDFLSRGLPLFFDNMQVSIPNFMLIVIHCYYMIYSAIFGMYVLKYRGSICSFSLCTRSKRLLHVRTKLSSNKNIFKRTKMLMNTPVYLDLSILEMNEIVIYKFGMIT